ncbi:MULTISPECIES: recombinase family protein [Paenibacillus]|uniref:recombinase family protein n=1 Tax=Paenibacillus TaxID=44249 RepID=UPI00096DEFB3|nr:recombinase family protein [Paenibacillus odorifer]OME08691.1 recombinase family protein [Paenibacillus odorifer]
MYTAIYGRVSTGMQVVEGHSLENQIELCMIKAIELGIHTDSVKVYREEGFSGEDIERPAMNELRQAINDHLIDRVIITHPDRLSRDLTDKLFLCREFESRDVQLIFVDTEYQNTPEGQLFFNLMSVIAQYELSLIKKRTVRGRLKAVEKDKKIMPMRVPPFGYDWVEGKLLINQMEADYVRKVYHWYLNENMTIRQIGNKLFDLGVPPKRSANGNWGASSIARILCSEIYIGKYYYNRRKVKKIKGQRTQTGAPKKTYSVRDRSEWIMVEVEPIVSVELFAQVRQQRVKNNTRSGNMHNNYLLRSLIRCGDCGHKWGGTTYSGRKDKKTGTRVKYRCYRCLYLFPRVYGITDRCPTRSIRADVLEEFIWDMVMEALSNPEDYIKRLEGQVAEVVDELLLTAGKVQGQIEDKRKETDKLKIMFRRDVISEDELATESHKLTREINDLQTEFDRYEEQIKKHKERHFSHEENIKLIERINMFISSKGAELAFDDKRFIVESLIDDVIIKSDEEGFNISIVGSLSELVGTQNEKGTDTPFTLNKKLYMQAREKGNKSG